MRVQAFRTTSLLLLMVLGSVNAGAVEQRGVVSGVAVTPGAARTGTTITATVTGTNPCGAVFIDWGDGTAVTHPIVDLPTTHTHAYSHGGNYTVRVRGMGNCDGDVTAPVRIEGPAPAPAQPKLTGFNVASPAGRGEPVSMRMEGQGTCNVSVAFGDGNTQEFSVQLPHTFTHVYSVPRGYNVTASANAPCEGGRHTARLEVEGGTAPSPPRLSGITATANPLAPGTATIQIAGNGSCSYLLDYGDGNNERRSGALPERVNHAFPAGGTFVVVATAEPPCQGRVQDTITLPRARGTGAVDRLVISPQRTRARAVVNITIEGRGGWRVFVDFDDGKEQTIEGQLPLRVSHTFVRPGRYEVFAWTEAPCRGDGSGVVQIDR
jgi:hypothetical protein